MRKNLKEEILNIVFPDGKIIPNFNTVQLTYDIDLVFDIAKKMALTLPVECTSSCVVGVGSIGQPLATAFAFFTKVNLLIVNKKANGFSISKDITPINREVNPKDVIVISDRVSDNSLLPIINYLISIKSYPTTVICLFDDSKVLKMENNIKSAVTRFYSLYEL